MLQLFLPLRKTSWFLFKLIKRDWLTKQIALIIMATMEIKKLSLSFSSNIFCDYIQTHRLAHYDNGIHGCGTIWIGGYVAHKGTVDLDLNQWQLFQIVNDDCPVPKSSNENLTPSDFSVCIFLIVSSKFSSRHSPSAPVSEEKDSGQFQAALVLPAQWIQPGAVASRSRSQPA